MKKFSKLTDKIDSFYKKAQEVSEADVVNLQDSLRKLLNLARSMPGVENYLKEGYNLALEKPEDKAAYAKKVKQFYLNLNQQVSLSLPPSSSNNTESKKYHEAVMSLESNIDMVLNPQVKRNKPVPEFLDSIKSVLDRVSAAVEVASKRPSQEKDKALAESKSMLERLSRLVLTASSSYSSSYPSKTDKLSKLEKMLGEFSILMNLKLGADYLKTLKPSVDNLVAKFNKGKTIQDVDKATPNQVKEFGELKSFL